MQDDLEPQRPAEDERRHQYWLALKAAHEKYLASSALTETIAAEESGRGAESELVRALEVQQQAFQEYIEARIQFMECHIDQARADERAPAALNPARQSKQRWYRGGTLPDALRKSLFAVVIGAIVGATTFYLTDEMGSHTSRIDGSTPKPAPAASSAELPPAIAIARPKSESRPAPARNLARGVLAAAAPRHVVANRFNFKKTPRSRRAGTVPAPRQDLRVRARSTRFGPPVYYEVSLSPSRRSVWLGPLQVILSSIDPHGKLVRLVIVPDSGRTNPRQPVSNQAARNAPGDRELAW